MIIILIVATSSLDTPFKLKLESYLKSLWINSKEFILVRKMPFSVVMKKKILTGYLSQDCEVNPSGKVTSAELTAPAPAEIEVKVCSSKITS